MDNIKQKTLEEIENRLLEIEIEKPRRLYELKEDYTGSDGDEIEALNIDYLDTEKTRLEMKRRFILDKRYGWKAKTFWSIVAPIIVAVVITIITNYLISD